MSRVQPTLIKRHLHVSVDMIEMIFVCGFIIIKINGRLHTLKELFISRLLPLKGDGVCGTRMPLIANLVWLLPHAVLSHQVVALRIFALVHIRRLTGGGWRVEKAFFVMMISGRLKCLRFPLFFIILFYLIKYIIILLSSSLWTAMSALNILFGCFQ